MPNIININIIVTIYIIIIEKMINIIISMNVKEIRSFNILSTKISNFKQLTLPQLILYNYTKGSN